ncbi:myosin-2 [Thalictrum thalictroides]|uniref:Myosin-2 n=1 Tax=Thalictrum thalictroides TaxID=46969 RepID=A0A7J6VMK2_THATH|nr:myosin-2 [Thalictrum thalictroides]
MMLMQSPTNASARSSLEEMLDSIRQRDDKPKDLPPALPVRPVSRARLPKSRKQLPSSIMVDESAPVKLCNVLKEKERKIRDRKRSRDEKELGFKGGGFGSKRMSMVDLVLPDDTPYTRKAEMNDHEERSEENNNTSDAPSPVELSVDESEWGENIQYILRKPEVFHFRNFESGVGFQMDNGTLEKHNHHLERMLLLCFQMAE